MPSKYPVLGNRSIDKWKVVELKEELRRRNLATKGLKEELVKRLDEALRSEMESCNDGGPNDEEQLGVDDAEIVIDKNETADNDASMVDIDTSSQDINQGVTVQDGDAAVVTNFVETVEEAAPDVVSMDKHAINSESVQLESSGQEPMHDEKLEDLEPSTEDVVLSVSEPNNQVSEVSQDLGFQVICESNSTDSVSLNEKNKLKDNLNADNFHLEVEVSKSEMVQPSSSNELPVGGNLDPVYVDQELGKDVTSLKEENDEYSVKKEDGVCGSCPEKLNSDRSDTGELMEGVSMLDGAKPDIGKGIDADKGDAVEYYHTTGGFSPDQKDIAVEEKAIPIAPIEERKLEVTLEETDTKHSSDVGLTKKMENADGASSEKVNSDGSFADDFMEEDVLETKLVESNAKLDEVREMSEVKKVEAVDEETLVDVVAGGSSPEKEIFVEDKMRLTVQSDKSEADDGEYAAGVDIIKKEDIIDVGSPEKLNLDRSSGDESMEEDVSETKHVESNVKSDGVQEMTETNKVDAVDEGTQIHAITCGLYSDRKGIAEEKTKPTVLVEKRKLEDKITSGINETPKRQRRWFPDAIKVPESQAPSFSVLSSPNDAVQQPTPRRTFSRSDSALSGDSPKERIVPPSQKPATTSLRIDRFLRPFTLKAVQEMLAKTGTVCTFWMDQIKTHCYVTYSSVEEAVATRNAVYNLQWPPNGGRLLVADFVDPQDVKVRAEAPPQSPAPVTPTSTTPSAVPFQQPPGPQPTRQNSLKQQKLPGPPLPPPPPLFGPPAKEPLPPPPAKNPEPAVLTLDDLFKKTRATPRIYYLPLSEEQVAAKLAAQPRV